METIYNVAMGKRGIQFLTGMLLSTAQGYLPLNVMLTNLEKPAAHFHVVFLNCPEINTYDK